MSDWKIGLVTMEAVRLLNQPNSIGLPHDARVAMAIDLAYENLQGGLPFEDASDLYCDIDARFPEYVAAINAEVLQ